MDSDAVFMKSLEKEIKALGWKKLAGSFFTELDHETLAHFNPFPKETGILRVQMHTSSKLLNRISWRIYGLPDDFGSLKEHLINACKCNITSLYVAREDPMHAVDIPSHAELIAQECRKQGENFNSIGKIVLESEEKSRTEPHIDRSIELICGYVAQSNFAKAMRLIKEKKSADYPGYGISFFAHAERFLSSQSQENLKSAIAT